MSREGIGKVYDLDSLFKRLNDLYFDGKITAQIRWSTREAKKAKSRVILGYFSVEKNRITLSRRLDSPRVPLFFVEHILFHEMLHAVFPSERHQMHTEKFNAYERMHPDFDRARAWEKQSIGILFEKSQRSLPWSPSSPTLVTGLRLKVELK